MTEEEGVAREGARARARRVGARARARRVGIHDGGAGARRLEAARRGGHLAKLTPTAHMLSNAEDALRGNLCDLSAVELRRELRATASRPPLVASVMSMAREKRVEVLRRRVAAERPFELAGSAPSEVEPATPIDFLRRRELADLLFGVAANTASGGVDLADIDMHMEDDEVEHIQRGMADVGW